MTRRVFVFVMEIRLRYNNIYRNYPFNYYNVMHKKIMNIYIDRLINILIIVAFIISCENLEIKTNNTNLLKDYCGK